MVPRTKRLFIVKVTPTEIQCRLKCNGNDAVNKSTVIRWVLKFRGWQPENVIIFYETRSGRLITATDNKHQKIINGLIQND